MQRPKELAIWKSSRSVQEVVLVVWSQYVGFLILHLCFSVICRTRMTMNAKKNHFCHVNYIFSQCYECIHYNLSCDHMVVAVLFAHRSIVNSPKEGHWGCMHGGIAIFASFTKNFSMHYMLNAKQLIRQKVKNKTNTFKEQNRPKNTRKYSSVKLCKDGLFHWETTDSVACVFYQLLYSRTNHKK